LSSESLAFPKSGPLHPVDITKPIESQRLFPDAVEISSLNQIQSVSGHLININYLQATCSDCIAIFLGISQAPHAKLQLDLPALRSRYSPIGIEISRRSFDNGLEGRELIQGEASGFLE
jgi:hypothetical protein